MKKLTLFCLLLSCVLSVRAASLENLANGADQGFNAAVLFGNFSGRLVLNHSGVALKSDVKAQAFGNVVSGSGMVSGEVNAMCPIIPWPPGNVGGVGNTSGFVSVSGMVSVGGAGGIHGDIPISGYGTLSLMCSEGEILNSSGYIQVSGTGTVYDSKGNSLGAAHVSGMAYVNGAYQISGNVNVNGSY